MTVKKTAHASEQTRSDVTERREAVEAVSAHLPFLPPYSPDFNPIENIFAQMEAWIRRVAPRTIDVIQDAVCGAINDVCHRQAAACFTAAV